MRSPPPPRTGSGALFVTGATGLLGRRVLARLLRAEPDLHVRVLARDPAGWPGVAAREGIPERRATAVRGDVTLPGLGLDDGERARLAGSVEVVLHCAADTVFSRPLPDARRVNTAGTRHLLELAASWPRVRRFVHVSTAFVAGRRTGRIEEDAHPDGTEFVNFYEQSKAEAEAIVRAGPLPWVVVRPSTVVCDGPDGVVSQFNAVHRALRLYHAGLAPMLPGRPDSPVDLVPADHVAACLAELTRAPGAEGRTFHVCAGDGSIGLDELLATAEAVFAESDEWRRKAIARPALTDLATYRLFERTVEQSADARLKAITASLSHFVPQLSLPKRFEVTNTEAVTGRRAPAVSTFWEPMLRHLLATRWAAAARRAA